jgi:hypothetical protein
MSFANLVRRGDNLRAKGETILKPAPTTAGFFEDEFTGHPSSDDSFDRQ